MKTLFRIAKLMAVIVFLLTIPSPDVWASDQAVETEPPRPIYSPLFLQPQYHLPPLDGVLSLPRDASSEATLTSWNKITFYSYRSDNWDVYRNDMEGGSDVRLTTHTKDDIEPRLNRGCTRIVFVSNRKGGDYHIYSMDLDGLDLKQLTSGDYDNFSPDWSPDGTQIVFESYRDGDYPEIYLMNADGSNATRLTFDSDYDGMPVWSPEGNKIAFISHRTGGYRVYTMNPDGSAQTILNGQYYSAHPQWSPDGRQIAYDSDGDNDGWQEIWLMNADGANQREVYDPATYYDSYVSSWSPDGEYVAFSRVHWVQIGGVWYWDKAYLYKLNISNNSAYLLGSSDTDWDPDWQSTDAEPPVSSMAALPTISPAVIGVSWSGSDNLSGLNKFDVQVRDGVSGIWTDWLVSTKATTGSYTGLGGHSYYFRVRAHDNGGNIEAWSLDYDVFTTVESTPPRTSVTSLPEYLRNGSLIEWGGYDPGDSSIQSYDVQYRNFAEGDWVDWQVGTSETSAPFTGIVNDTYFFRSRATDKAQNIEVWPTGDGDTSTKLYTWGITGIIQDNTGIPVSTVHISTFPEAGVTIPSDRDGHYAAYVFETTSDYAADWEKEGYGDLPITVFTGTRDAEQMTIMPPIDNIVSDWGFEDTLHGSDWQFAGTIPPITAESASYTGNYGAQFGQKMESLFSTVKVADTDVKYPNASAVIDNNGVTHIVWESQGIYYTRRNADGSWTNAKQLTTDTGAAIPKIGVDGDGSLHVAWTSNGDIYYTYHELENDWSIPVNLTKDPSSEADSVQIMVEASGVVHLVWIGRYYSAPYIIYAGRGLDGNWSTPTTIVYIYYAYSPYISQVVLDDDGIIHVLISNSNINGYYIRRASDGSWSDLEDPVYCYYERDYNMSVDENGAVHISFLCEYNNRLYYLQRSPEGVWSSPTDIYGYYNYYPKMVVSPNGVVHLMVCHDGLQYLRRDEGGTWDDPQSVGGCPNPPIVHLMIDDRETLHLWSNFNYYQKISDSSWMYVTSIPRTPIGALHDLTPLIDDSYTVHVVWASDEYPSDIYYAGPPTIEQDSDSLLIQTVTIPVTMTTPTLSYLYDLIGLPVTDGSWFNVEVSDSVSTTLLASYNNSINGWRHGWHNLSAWAGQTITLTFALHQTAGYHGLYADLDEVTLGAAHPDTWVNVNGTTSAQPGDTIKYQITYGNRGFTHTNGLWITDTLPVELAFLKASIPPTITGQTLSWEVGELSPNSGPFTIVVTATLNIDVPLMINVTNTVAITNSHGELETANNIAEASTFVGNRVYLPVILR